MKKRIGLIGLGVIGSYIFHKVNEEDLMEIGFVFETDYNKTKQLDSTLILESIADLQKKPVDLVVEVANAQAVWELVPTFIIDYTYV